MSDYSVDIQWELNGAELSPGNYDTDHDIVYSDQYRVRGTAAPDWGGNPDFANPEQALAASLSSCHMMTFLALAAKARWPLKHYSDHATAHVSKNPDGRMAVTAINLSPKIEFEDGFSVDADKLEQMHDRAHRYCFIANSLSDTVSVTID